MGEEEDTIGEEGKMTTPGGEISSTKDEMKPGKAAVPVIRVRRGPLRWVSVSMFDAYDIFVDDDDDEKSVPTIIKDLTKSFAIGQPSVAGHQELLKGIKQRLRDILNKLSKQGKSRMKFDHGEKAAKKEEEEEEREKEKEEKMDKKDDKKEVKDKKDDKKEDKDKKDDKKEDKDKKDKENDEKKDKIEKDEEESEDERK